MTIILLSFLSNVYMECINVIRIKWFTHISENVKAVTQIRFILLQPYYWSFMLICVFWINPHEGLHLTSSQSRVFHLKRQPKHMLWSLDVINQQTVWLLHFAFLQCIVAGLRQSSKPFPLHPKPHFSFTRLSLYSIILCKQNVQWVY